MYISTRNTARGPLFIIHFPASDIPAVKILTDLHSYAQTMHDSIRDDFVSILNKIQERLTDKFAQEPGEQSSLLFDDEIADFLSYFMMWSAVKGF